jgi:hypothetical protein
MKRSFTIKAFLVVSVLTLMVLPGCTPKMKNVKLSHTFFNFDAHVWVKDSVNDFHLDMCCLDTAGITKNWFIPFKEDENGRRTYIKPWGYEFYTKQICCGTRAIWEFKPLPHCHWVHVGIGFKHNPCVRPLGVVWTYDGKPIARAPFPMQIWRIEEEELIDVIFNPKHCYPDCEREKWGRVQDITGPIEIERSWAGSDRVFELEELVWDNDSLMNRKWQDEKTIELKVGDSTVLKIEDAMKYKAVLVRYTVRSLHPEAKEEVIYHFINEAVIAQE